MKKTIEVDAKFFAELCEAASKWHRQREELLSRRDITGMDIARQVADETGFEMSEILGPDKRRDLAHARQYAMWRISRETELSLPQIGRIFKRDHTTVIHGIRAHEARTNGTGAVQ